MKRGVRWSPTILGEIFKINDLLNIAYRSLAAGLIPSQTFSDLLPIPLRAMAPNERTQLLAKPAPTRAYCPEEWDGKTATAQTSEKFTLWQIGALCGKQLLRMMSSTLG